MQVIWETRAANDLVEYQEYIHQFNPKASIDVVDRIFDYVELESSNKCNRPPSVDLKRG